MVLFSSLLFVIISCDNNDLTEQVITNEKDQKALFKEVSLLLGKVITNPGVRQELNIRIKEADPIYGSVSFAYLLNEDNDLKKNELEVKAGLLKSARLKHSLFGLALNDEFKKNIDQYPTIKEKCVDRFSPDLKSTSFLIDEDLNRMLIKENLQVFYPYIEFVDNKEYANDDRSINEFYVSYATQDGSLRNEAFGFLNQEGFKDKLEIDNDFIDRNPVYVIVPIDPCDIPGQPCNSIELFPIEELNSSLPPPLFNGPKLLTYNIDDKDIPEDKSILTTMIKSIRFRNTSWMGFGGTHQKIELYRGSADGISITPNGISVTGSKYMLKYYRIRRKYVSRSNWLKLNAEYDPDWTRIESTQSMAVFSIHKFAATASTNMTGKANVKVGEDGKPVYSSENSYSTSISLKVDEAKFRGNVELSRRQVLATIIGKGTTNKSRIHDGHEWNVKSIGIIDYYFYHYYQDLN